MSARTKRNVDATAAAAAAAAPIEEGPAAPAAAAPAPVSVDDEILSAALAKKDTLVAALRKNLATALHENAKLKQVLKAKREEPVEAAQAEQEE